MSHLAKPPFKPLSVYGLTTFRLPEPPLLFATDFSVPHNSYISSKSDAVILLQISFPPISLFNALTRWKTPANRSFADLSFTLYTGQMVNCDCRYRVIGTCPSKVPWKVKPSSLLYIFSRHDLILLSEKSSSSSSSLLPLSLVSL